jgi:hypothetical protein
MCGTNPSLSPWSLRGIWWSSTQKKGFGATIVPDLPTNWWKLRLSPQHQDGAVHRGECEVPHREVKAGERRSWNV